MCLSVCGVVCTDRELKPSLQHYMSIMIEDLQKPHHTDNICSDPIKKKFALLLLSSSEGQG